MSSPQLVSLSPNKLQSSGVTPCIVTHLQALLQLWNFPVYVSQNTCELNVSFPGLMRRVTTRYIHYSAIYLFWNQFSCSAVNVVNMGAGWLRLITTPNSTPLRHTKCHQWHLLTSLLGDKHISTLPQILGVQTLYPWYLRQCHWLDTNKRLLTNPDIILLIYA